MIKIELTETDYKIIALLQRDARVRMETLAMETGTSVATVQRRIRELRRKGVIIGDVTVIAPEAAGFAMTFFIMVELERESIHQLDEFRRKMKAEPRV
jgi:Lrp/AsnC family leucine-responsive transcriptional regulator